MRGLRLQLALFYILLSLPALVFIEHASIAFKFERLLDELDDGRVQRVVDAQVEALAESIREGASKTEIELRLQRFVLQLERPRESLGTSAAYVLLELARHPFHASLTLDGQPLGSAGEPARVGSNVRRSWLGTSERKPESAAVARDGTVRLNLELSVPSPWRRFGDRLSFEWPIAVFYLMLFLLGSAWFLRRRVLVRIERMGEAARAWAGGDFSAPIADRGSDELGALAAELDRMAIDLQTLVDARAELAAHAERGRLARDLHDTVKQKVFALSLQLAAAREGADDAGRAQQRLIEASSLVEEIQGELADLLRELNTDADPAEDLLPPLLRRLQDFSRRSGCAMQHRLPEHLPLPSNQVDTVLRIVDEALANVWRHAMASAVEIALTHSGGKVELSIRDDGRGGVAESPAGMGMANMRHRTASLENGQLQVQSIAGGGTRLQLSFSAPSAVHAR